jgi:RNA polymerase sigma-70 factor (ECF subfamily)
MAPPHDDSQPADAQAGQFRTTRWSVVLAVRQEDDGGRGRALEELCRTYWYPVYAFVRRQGHATHDAKDLTQAFFAHVIERQTLAKAQREKGRFRAFLLGALKNFLAYEARKRATIKRGGQAAVIDLDEEGGEERYQRDLAHEATPEKLYLRSWADSLLGATFDLLRRDYERAGRIDLFDRLSPHLSGQEQKASYKELGDTLGLSVGAVTTSVYRMRRRYGELLREQIAHTVASPNEIDDEIGFLFAALEA